MTGRRDESPPPGNQDQNQFGWSDLIILKGKESMKYLFILLMVLILCGFTLYVIDNDAIKDLYTKVTDSEKHEQYQKLSSQFTPVQSIIQKWNLISSIDDTHTEHVKHIRKNILNVKNLYQNLKIDKLGQANIAIWNLNVAKLNIIMYDLTSEDQHYIDAMAHINEAKKVGKKAPDLSVKELNALMRVRFYHNLTWTELAAYSLRTYNGKHDVKQIMMKIRNAMGGCSFFRSEGLAHTKMKDALECE
ncbi:hypothetical protein [Pseudoalteromonas rubra]|uniref:Uncharacterized protein n=1 Tax=Pseudoalteromonas rubra TaxID=43658 RepID=A0A5S3X555_9GAMM|nr:hypothetical protein [Pseudoalteromonas rubra]TMP39702.1 hypothetical protein CWB98_03695 [Pseudoalteromonas rubra]